ncbi:MAG TPA: hypothetical protein VL382_10065 [Terriglobales bacterium]|nr:hypothetical protein [Terriglobales bacterium]
MRPYITTLLSVLASLALAGAACAQAPAGGTANDLVRRVIKNEDHANAANERYMYKLRSEKPERSVVKQMIETNDGVVARLIAVNDKPPTAEQRAADDRKLDKLVNDPDERRDRMQEQKKDEERGKMMVKALPDAFLYVYDGEETINGVRVTRLAFKPNPDFDPPSRETLVYRGMKGHLWVEPKAERLVRIEADLFEDVTFGWGILGHLDKGGHFAVEQSDIGDGRWETTRMHLDFTGRALLFKAIKIKETEVTSDFHKVPANLTLTQGVEMLRRSDQYVAQSAAAGRQGR